jgi:hypothetical protein
VETGWPAEIIRSILDAADDAAASSAVGSALTSRPGSPTRDEAKSLLDGLRGARHFGAMARLADGLLARGADGAYVRRQYAQALIELGLLDLADKLLHDLVGRLSADEIQERSETYGLLGRAHKQQFVAFQSDRDRAAHELQTAVRHYQTCYDLDPAWHGANLVGLVHRAERDGIFPGIPDVTSEAVARRLLADLEGKKRTEWTAWTHAAAAGAHLALEEWPKMLEHYGAFVNGGVDGFALAGEVRQLREIWGVMPGGDHPSAQLLLAMEARILTSGGGTVACAPGDLVKVTSALQSGTSIGDAPLTGKLQAILGDNPLVPLTALLRLGEAATRVCQVVDRDLHAQGLKSGGTGFLVDGAALGLGREPVLVTNNHVLSAEGLSPSIQHKNAEVIFHFWKGKDEPKRFRIRELAWECPREQLDVALARIADEGGNPPDLDGTLAIYAEPEAFRPVDPQHPDRVYLVGHPDGRGLEFSLSDNTVIDHELLDRPRPALCRIHYGAPTEGGMSGAPVLDARRYQVVGLHRVGRARPMRAQAPKKYEANEAVWLGSILSARRPR